MAVPAEAPRVFPAVGLQGQRRLTRNSSARRRGSGDCVCPSGFEDQTSAVTGSGTPVRSSGFACSTASRRQSRMIPGLVFHGSSPQATSSSLASRSWSVRRNLKRSMSRLAGKTPSPVSSTRTSSGEQIMEMPPISEGSCRMSSETGMFEVRPVNIRFSIARAHTSVFHVWYNDD